MATHVRVKMRGAICLQPLTLEQADRYLAHFGPELEGLRTALKKNQALQELARSPLMLDTMTLAYQGASTDDSIREANEAREARHARMFDTYVSKMFKTKGKVVSNAYTTTQTNRWLSWLAHDMKRQSQAIFVALVQPICLNTSTKLFLYCSLSRLLVLVCLFAP